MLFLLFCQSLCLGLDDAGETSKALDPWRDGVRVSVVLDADCHSIHSYFGTSPESPDGRWVLSFRSTARDAHRGDVCLVARNGKEVRVLASDVIVEDSHRVACQQWLSGGRRVLFHDLRDDEWVVVSVDVPSGREKILAKGRQVGWGCAGGDLVPLYGPHWAPGEHRDLELLDVETGQIRTVLGADAVRQAYPEWVQQQFGDAPISIFFPTLSPDLSRAFFKIAAPAGGGFRSGSGSKRNGLICCDLGTGQLVYMSPRWGHPAWHPDSRRIVNISDKGVFLIDSETGARQGYDTPTRFSGGHPSLSPDGRLFTTDAQLDALGGPKGFWGAVVGDVRSGEYEVVHRFDNSQGASSWRRCHPHPAFSPDGRRVYFNVSAGRWTRLYVAEQAKGTQETCPPEASVRSAREDGASRYRS